MDIPLSALYDTSAAPVEAEIFDVGNTLILNSEQLEDTPSRNEGLSKALEDRVRLLCCEIVYGVLTLCGVDRTVTCTAQIYLHRYYCQRSVAAFDYKYIALGVIYLALKTEETNITEEELIPVFCRFLRRAYASDEKASKEFEWILRRNSEFNLWFDWLVCIELEILIAFGFKLHVPQPHKLMFAYMQKLELTKLMQEAWTVLNDSFSTTACIQFKAEDLACGAIFYTAKKHKTALPEGGQYPWWELFGAAKDALYQFALLVHELYERPEVDFDFTADLEISYRNDRADALKKPHPSLLHPALDPADESPVAKESQPVARESSAEGRSRNDDRIISASRRRELRHDTVNRSDRDRNRRRRHDEERSSGRHKIRKDRERHDKVRRRHTRFS